VIVGDYPAAVRADDGDHDGQAQASSPVRAASGSIGAAEPLEGMRQEAGRKAWPVIANLNHYAWPVQPQAGLAGHSHSAARRSVPNRVVDQVVHGLSEPVRIGYGGQALAGIQPDCYSAGLGLSRETANRGRQHPGDVDLPGAQACRTVLGAGQQQQILGPRQQGLAGIGPAGRPVPARP
jgi:hypothetical protein